MSNLTAHDVRKLTVCFYCGQLASKDNMVAHNSAHIHGSCFITVFGLQKFKKLPKEQTNKLTLDDIGPNVMRLLLNKK